MPQPTSAFVSFGPCCLGAELLKALDVRVCTYGFDWCRSGALEHKDFLRLGAEKFFEKHVKSPIVRLKQISSPYLSPTKTTELDQVKPLYGYQYTYNPHRDLNLNKDLDYLRRCFLRLDTRISEGLKNPFVVLLSDYTNKKGYIHFNNPQQSAEYLSGCFCCFRNIRPYIRVIRYTVCDAINNESVNILSTSTGDSIEVSIPQTVDSNTKLRREYYRRLYPLFLKT